MGLKFLSIKHIDGERPLNHRMNLSSSPILLWNSDIFSKKQNECKCKSRFSGLNYRQLLITGRCVLVVFCDNTLS